MMTPTTDQIVQILRKHQSPDGMAFYAAADEIKSMFRQDQPQNDGEQISAITSLLIRIICFFKRK